MDIVIEKELGLVELDLGGEDGGARFHEKG